MNYERWKMKSLSRMRAAGESTNEIGPMGHIRHMGLGGSQKTANKRAVQRMLGFIGPISPIGPIVIPSPLLANLGRGDYLKRET